MILSLRLNKKKQGFAEIIEKCYQIKRIRNYQTK